MSAQFGEATFGRLAAPGVKEAAKLLVTPFAQPVIPAVHFQTIEVFRHLMKHHLTSRLNLRPRFGFHARKQTVKALGDNSEIARGDRAT